tara:strand:+ start:1198 stop:1593 length:396 start_codon:yes stop_codon:yes gene_type:complete
MWEDILKRKMTRVAPNFSETYREAKSAELLSAKNALKEAEKALQTKYIDRDKRATMENLLYDLKNRLDDIRSGGNLKYRSTSKRSKYDLDEALEAFSEHLAYFYEALEYGTDSQRQADFKQRMLNYKEEKL